MAMAMMSRRSRRALSPPRAVLRDTAREALLEDEAALSLTKMLSSCEELHQEPQPHDVVGDKRGRPAADRVPQAEHGAAYHGHPRRIALRVGMGAVRWF